MAGDEDLPAPCYPEDGTLVRRHNTGQARSVVSINTCSPTQLMQHFEQGEQRSIKPVTSDLLSVLRADHDMLMALEQEHAVLASHLVKSTMSSSVCINLSKSKDLRTFSIKKLVPPVLEVAQ